MKYTATNSASFDESRKVLAGADVVLLGIGAGATASGGLNYADSGLVERWYPDYRALGLTTILDIMGRLWSLRQSMPEEYWGFWAKHIFHIRHEPEALEPYRLLRQLMDGKDYFILSTNVDKQLEKAGFPAERIFTPQGDYGMFQCLRPCSQKLYGNREMIAGMLENMPGPFRVRTEDVPVCPDCGAYLVPNLRMDSSFVEAPHMVRLPDYRQFLAKSEGRSLALLELGVGYNTPAIIRFPFEDLAKKHAHARLVRVNLDSAEAPEGIKGRSLSFPMDITVFLRMLLGLEPGAAADEDHV